MTVLSHRRGNIAAMTSDFVSLNLYIGGRSSLAVTARVIEDDPSGRLLWIARGTPSWRVSLPDGVHLRDIPVDTEPPGGHRLIESEWSRNEALVWQPTDLPYAVWTLFDDRGFTGWYVNLEHRRCGGGRINVFDHELDIEVAADRTWRWKDVASFEAKIGTAGYWTREEADRIGLEAEAVTADIDAGRGPFDGRWNTFRPDAAWAVPVQRPERPKPRLIP